MGQVSSRISSILGYEKTNQNGNYVNEADNNLSRKKPIATPIYKNSSDELQNKKSFFSFVTPRLPIKRSRQVSPESNTLSQSLVLKDIFSPNKRVKMDDYLNFTFLKDYPSISYIKKSKVMFILRGLPGSGKSTLCNTIKNTYLKCVVCSADNFFLKDDGEYQYDFSKISEAHEHCQLHAIEAVINQTHVVIIDNTNVRHWEMKFYLELAKEFNYIPIIAEPKTPWKKDVDALVEKNSHNVSKEVMKNKMESYEELVPLYFGWFLNEKDSYLIHLESQDWFKEAFEFEDFRKTVRSFTGCKNIEDFNSFFTKPRNDVMLHCTAKYFTFEERTTTSEQKEALLEVVGKFFAIEIVGFVLTPRSIGAKLKLTQKQKTLWFQDDNEEVPASFKDITPMEIEDENTDCPELVRPLVNGSSEESVEAEVINECIVREVSLSENASMEEETEEQIEESAVPELQITDLSINEESTEAAVNGIEDDSMVLNLSSSVVENGIEEANVIDSHLSDSMTASAEESEDATLPGAITDVEQSENSSNQEENIPVNVPTMSFKNSPLKLISPQKGKKIFSPRKGKGKGRAKFRKSPQKKTSIPKYSFSADDSSVERSLSETYMKLDENNFLPTLGEGRRAHLTLAVAPDVSPATTGLDLILANDLEQLSCAGEASVSENGCSPLLKSKQVCLKTIALNGATLKYYDHGIWVIYLENKLVVSSLFAMKSA